MATLYVLTSTEQSLLDAGDDPNLDQDELQRRLDAIQGKEQDKLFSYGKVSEEAQAKAKAIKEKVKLLTARAKSYNNLADRLNETAKQVMEQHGWKKLENDEQLLQIINNGGVQPLIIDTDELPAYMYRSIEEPDKDAIKQALKAGKTVEGAHFAPRGTHLEVK